MRRTGLQKQIRQHRLVLIGKGGRFGLLLKRQSGGRSSMDLIRLLTDPPTLYSRSMVFSLPCPVPAERGIYGWFFKAIPGVTPIDRCVTKGGSHTFVCRYLTNSRAKSSTPL